MKFRPIILITEKEEILKIDPSKIKHLKFDFALPIITLKSGKVIKLNKDDYKYTDWLTFIHHLQMLFNI